MRPPDPTAGDANNERRAVRPSVRTSTHPGGPTRVLVVSPEAARRRALAAALMEEHDALTAEDEAVGLSLLANTAVDVVVAELGRRSGAEMVDAFAAARPGVEVVLLGGETMSSEASARTGAFCLLDRASGTPTQVAWTVSRACERKRLLERIRRLERKVEHQDRSGEIIGGSRAMDEVFDLAHGAAVASSSVLLVGESGTGKEMLARAIHRQGRRASGPFVAVDCAALPVDRIEHELFGSAHGGSHRPLVQAADGGTLFLADVAMLPASAQAQLVQLLQHGEISRDEQSRPVDIRLIAATTIELKPRVDDGDVRRDLYFHLNAMVIRIPPLRRRKDDIPLLAYHFLHRYGQRIGRSMRRISPEALRLLRDHRWAGNVRELEHVIERAVALARSDVVLPADLSFLRGEQAGSVVLPAGDEPRDTAFDPALFDLPYAEAKKQAVAAFDQAYVNDLLRRTGENVSEAARQSGLDRSNFRRVMKKVGRSGS